jgi:hypothetical protein
MLNQFSLPAHPGESRDPVLSSLTLAFQDYRSSMSTSLASPKALGPGFRRDERNLEMKG